jgi:hypothetical protein
MTVPDERVDAQQKLVERAVSDPAFRQELLANPSEAIQDGLGFQLPPNVRVRVIEEQPGEVIVVLPAQPVASGSALSDADLELVAGGGGMDSWYPWDSNFC